MTTNTGKPVVGTQDKYTIRAIFPGSAHLGDTDTSITAKFFYRKGDVYTVEKSSMVRVDSDCYIVFLDTSLIGAGNILRCQLTIVFNDIDSPTGKRTVIKEYELKEELVNAV